MYLAEPGEGLLKVYGPDGQFVRQIGRRGAGPGEFEIIRNVLLARDGSLRVLDAVLGRLTAFSQNGEYLGSTTVPVSRGIGMPAVLLSDQRLIVNARLTSVSDTAFALQVIDQEGRVARQFDETPGDPRKPWRQERLLCLRSSGELLVARPYSFTMSVYSPDFSRRMSLLAQSSSIPSHDPEEDPSDGRFDKPPTAALRTIWEDSTGLVWLRMYMPSPSWRPGPPMAGETTSRETLIALAKRPRFETIIEVIDLDRRRVLARSRLAASIGTSVGGGYFAQPVEDSVGEPSLRILRVHLKK